MKAIILAAAALGITTTAAYAETPKPSEFVGKAGASDTFEIDSARLMVTSKNPAISKFATNMITDHAKSTKMVTIAAKADGLAAKKPSMTIKQRADLTALRAIPAGKTKDDLYVKQQKAAHEEALALMKDYSTAGSATHLKLTAGKIVPVVAMHEKMLASM
jgi:putative membrane protein